MIMETFDATSKAIDIAAYITKESVAIFGITLIVIGMVIVNMADYK